MKLVKCNIDEVVISAFQYQPSGVMSITCTFLADNTPVFQTVRPAPMSEKIDTAVKELCQVLEQALAEEIGQVELVKSARLPRGISGQEI